MIGGGTPGIDSPWVLLGDWFTAGVLGLPEVGAAKLNHTCAGNYRDNVSFQKVSKWDNMIGNPFNTPTCFAKLNILDRPSFFMS